MRAIVLIKQVPDLRGAPIGCEPDGTIDRELRRSDHQPRGPPRLRGGAGHGRRGVGAVDGPAQGRGGAARGGVTRRNPRRAAVRSDAGRLGHVGDRQRPRGGDRSARRRSRACAASPRSTARPVRSGRRSPPGSAGRRRRAASRWSSTAPASSPGGSSRAASSGSAFRCPRSSPSPRPGSRPGTRRWSVAGGRRRPPSSGSMPAISGSTRPRSASARHPRRWRTWSRRRCPQRSCRFVGTDGLTLRRAGPARSSTSARSPRRLTAPHQAVRHRAVVDPAAGSRSAATRALWVVCELRDGLPARGVAGAALEGHRSCSRPRWWRRRRRRREMRSAPPSTSWFATGSTWSWSPTTRRSPPTAPSRTPVSSPTSLRPAARLRCCSERPRRDATWLRGWRPCSVPVLPPTAPTSPWRRGCGAASASTPCCTRSVPPWPAECSPPACAPKRARRWRRFVPECSSCTPRPEMPASSTWP